MDITRIRYLFERVEVFMGLKFRTCVPRTQKIDSIEQKQFILLVNNKNRLEVPKNVSWGVGIQELGTFWYVSKLVLVWESFEVLV